MTELSNPPSPPENNAHSKASSPWVMLISMLLLITGLILSSVMLVYYATDNPADESKKSSFSVAELIGKGQALSAQSKPDRKQVEPEPVIADTKPAESGVKRFFSGDRPEEVRWPKLKLSGFGKGSHGQSDFAIINNNQILVGTPINGVILVEILNQGVVVEYKGEQKILTVKR